MYVLKERFPPFRPPDDNLFKLALLSLSRTPLASSISTPALSSYPRNGNTSKLVLVRLPVESNLIKTETLSLRVLRLDATGRCRRPIGTCFCRKQRFRSSSPRYRLSSAVRSSRSAFCSVPLLRIRSVTEVSSLSTFFVFLNKSTLSLHLARLIRKRETRAHTREKFVLQCTARCVSVYTLRERERMLMRVKCEENINFFPKTLFSLQRTLLASTYPNNFLSSSVHHNSQFFSFLFFGALWGVVFPAIFAQNEIALFLFFSPLEFNPFSRQT